MKYLITFLLLITFIYVHSQEYIPNTLIIKIKSEFKANCKSDNIEISSLQSYFEKFKISNVNQLFPNASLPGSKCKECVDITTIYKIQFKSKYSLILQYSVQSIAELLSQFCSIIILTSIFLCRSFASNYV